MVVTIQPDAEALLWAATAMVRDLFAQYDEVWLIGHKGDHHRNLIDLGALPSHAITVAHVHSSLGLHTEHQFRPPASSSRSLEGIVTAIHPGLQAHIKRVQAAGAKVCVLQPFPNEGFAAQLVTCGAQKNFVLTPPVAAIETYWMIEDKRRLASLLETYAHAAKYKPLQSVILPWATTKELGTSFARYKSHFNLRPTQGIYLQQAVSAGGSGTSLLRSQADIDELLRRDDWQRYAKAGNIKITPEMRDAYAANGSACIVPRGDGSCVVLVDPLSHKPMGSNFSSLGNDWSVLWPRSLQKQYIEMTVLLGHVLYDAFGYTGLFGPDYIVEAHGGHLSLKLTEINPRWQGTTPYQTANALLISRIPLELMHYIVKLDQTGQQVRKLITLIGDPVAYNVRSAAQRGVFYLKIMSSAGQHVMHDANGQYHYVGGKLHRLSVPSNASTEGVITIKAPKKGERLGKNLAPIGYAWGLSRRPIAAADAHHLTAFGEGLYAAVTQALFG